MGDALRLVRPPLLDAAVDRADTVSVLAGALALSADTPPRLVRTPVEVARLSYGDLPHLVAKGEARERYANFIVPTLRDPFEIWGVDYADGVRNRYIGVFKGGRDLIHAGHAAENEQPPHGEAAAWEMSSARFRI